VADPNFYKEKAMAARVSGTEGYAEAAEALLNQRLSFADVHRPVLHLMPNAPCRVLDVGSGAGTDAASFAEMGHSVVAVEPTDELRIPAMARYPSSSIEWLNDSLPDLAFLQARGGTFDLVMLSAVWMHLDAAQRRWSTPRVASLIAAGGMMIMSLRHGPVPQGRRMFEVSADETIQLAQAEGLDAVLNTRTDSVQEVNRRAGVTWTRLAFMKGPTIFAV
jgi:2-polyprenyl-3-methyl-5-hydroxy-6-metoxy-1,4-benzoquinol methylase